jgi:uncharacterized repeat protein (TIGR01451 family)
LKDWERIPMKSLAWKLATLAAVMGIGFLVLLQAQRGMNQALVNKPADTQGTSPTSPGTESAPVAKSPTEPSKPETVAEIPSQSEPQAQAPAKSTVPPTETPALAAPDSLKPDAPKPNSPKLDPEPKAIKTADSTTPASAGGNAPPANDPFGDFTDAKRATPSGNSSNSATNRGSLDLKPPSDVKQTSASGEENNTKSESANGKTSPAIEPAKAAAPAVASGPPALIEPKPPAGQSEPVDSPPPQQKPAEPAKGDKDASGPQLFAPGAQQEAPAASSGSPPKITDQPKNPAPLSLVPDTAKPEPNTNSSAKGNPDATPFPALDDEPAKTPSSTAPPTNTPKVSPPAQAATPTPAPHPDLFPIDQAKEVPLTKSPEQKTAEGKPTLPPTGPSLAAQPTNPKTADSGAPAVSQSTPPATTDLHSEPAPDFQGDGTISEQSPLGPQRPQLNIEKIAPPNALIGQSLVYSILVKNVGTSEARDVVVEDRIPKGTKLSGTIPRAELTGKKLIWRIGNIAPNDQRKIMIRVIPLEAGEIGSVATVNFVSEAAAETVVTAPRIEFELSAPKDAKLGGTVPFHFKVRNVGTGEARGVVIRDLIPQGLSHGAGNDLEYEIGRLPPGKARELTLDLKATKIGTTINRAVVVGEGGLSVKAEAAIEVSGSKIAVSRSGPQRRYLLRPAIYTNTLVNESKYDVEGVVAVETVPAGMEFAGATRGGQFNEGSRTIAWRIDHMAPGETCVVKSQLVPKSTGVQNGTVRVTVPNGEPAEASSQTTVEGFAALGVEVAGAEGPVDVGEKVTLRINARNKGTIAATNVVVTVDVPEQMAIVSVRGPGKRSQEGNQVQFGPIPTLEGRTAAACELVLQASKRGDSRIRVSLRADQVDKPLTREESVLVLSESSEPAASR